MCAFYRVEHKRAYLADAGRDAGVVVDASLHAAVAALAGREAHVTHGTPGHTRGFYGDLLKGDKST